VEPSTRWDALFADLAAQVELRERAERGQEIAERARIEYGSLTLRSRIAAGTGRSAWIQTVSGAFAGRIDQVGSDWLLLVGDGGRESLLPVGAVQTVRGLDRTSAPMPDSAVEHRLGIRSVLRAIARQRALVSVALRDGTTCTGTIDRVGSDMFDLTRRPPGDLLRGGESIVVALPGVVAVTRFAG
jgi:hypothetical protein